MADVKWIKIVTDLFENDKIMILETMPKADTLIVIWIKLLCLAGKHNNSGVFTIGNTPYTPKTFATVFKRPLPTVKYALETFESLGMIEIVNGTVTIPNWGKHQNLEKIELRNQYMKNYMRGYRAKQKAISEGDEDFCYVNCKPNVSVAEKNRLDNILDYNIYAENKLIDYTEEADVAADKDAFDSDPDNRLNNWGSNKLFLTKNQVKDLLDKLGGKVYAEYCNRLERFITENNANVKSHYDTILKWAKEDSMIS